MSGRIRSFVAIALSQPVRVELALLQQALTFGRVVPIENLHLTLVFLGETRVPPLEELHGALEGLHLPAPELRLRGMGTFGHPPHALWAGLEPNPALQHLQAKVAQAARLAGIAVPGRRYVPHVTLARTGPEEGAAAARFAALREGFAPPPFRPRGFALMESRATRSGPVYEALAEYPFLA